MNPTVAGRFLFPLHERLKGKPTLPWLRKLERSQWLSVEEIETLRSEALRPLIEHAYDHTVYYRRVMDKLGLTPFDIRSPGDLRRLPYLTRDDLRSHFDELQARPFAPRVQRISTGGSTGSPVTVSVSMLQHGFSEAARLRAQRWFGVEAGAKEVVLWGSPIELGRQTLWREARDRLLNSRLLSAFDLGEPALERYTNVLHHFRPWKLYGYASALALLAGYLRRVGRLPGPGWPRVVFATAEPLFDFQRDLIREVFGCPVAVEYGARDAGLIAHECPVGRLHVNAEGILVEIANDGLSADARKGEIVVTNLLSYAMPLIRYRTGDIGKVDSSPCPCRRGLPTLDRVDGRRTDFLVTTDGKIMHALAAIYILREIPSINEFQIIQEQVDRVTVSVVPGAGFDEESRAILVSRLQDLFGAETLVELKSVRAIARPPSGKHRYVISKVADERIRALVSAK